LCEFIRTDMSMDVYIETC